MADRRKAREARQRAAGRPVKTGPSLWVRFGLVLADVFGTVAACAALTIGAFLWLVPVGFVTLAVVLMVLDFKISWSRKQRAAAASQRRQP
ncbi:MAG TPA: hypothetical protein VJ625_17210 [Propionibacteriaceae bacterium]|nr:hypothetical protein [Propionibacteriaceae bacterium]